MNMKQLLPNVPGCLSLLILLTHPCGNRLAAQTQINLQHQSRAVDFSAASSTKPFSTGASLPATCATGQAFFLTNAVPGSNLYLCTSTNTWSVVSGSGGAGASSLAGITDFKVQRANDTTLVVGNCSVDAPCVYGFGDTAFQLTESPTITLSSGTGTVSIYIERGGGLIAGLPEGVSASCSPGCSVRTVVTSFPSDSLPLFTWSAMSGAWASQGTDLRAFLRREALVAGENVTLVRSGGQVIISAGAATTPGISGQGAGWLAPFGLPQTAAPAIASGSFASPADVRAFKFVAPFSIQTAAIAFYLATTPADSTCLLRFALYDAAGTFLEDGRTAECATTGWKTVSLDSLVPISAGGAYYVAWNSDDTGAQLGAYAANSSMISLLNISAVKMYGRAANAFTTSFPATLGGILAGAGADTGDYPVFVALLP